ncbi:hypothetical protein [Opitutus sp. ER46]|uniref:hypothetical protein n=1 Tax=Opitutus sp. ER46 TaxID=2161864 RepID=UPI0011B1E3A6|nr:hypothetical protein [Opitutus sp. ER46]
MITSRRDYILRIIDEVGRLVARIVFKRTTGADQEALELVVQGFERLFNLQRHQLFQFTPEQQLTMLTLDEPPEIARDKLLLYSALSTEAGRSYARMGNAPMARATFANALRFALHARRFASPAPIPDYVTTPEELRELMGPGPLDPDIEELLREQA